MSSDEIEEIESRYPKVSVGDLVRMICETHRGRGDVGVVTEVHDCGPWADDIIVLCAGGLMAEWEQDEVEVISGA